MNDIGPIIAPYNAEGGSASVYLGIAETRSVHQSPTLLKVCNNAHGISIYTSSIQTHPSLVVVTTHPSTSFRSLFPLNAADTISRRMTRLKSPKIWRDGYRIVNIFLSECPRGIIVPKRSFLGRLLQVILQSSFPVSQSIDSYTSYHETPPR